MEIRVDEGHKHGISSACSAVHGNRRSGCFATKELRWLDRDVGAVRFSGSGDPQEEPGGRQGKSRLWLPHWERRSSESSPEAVSRTLTPQAAAQVAAAFNEVGEYARASGVCPILECGHDIIKGRAEAVEVIRRVQASNFGVLWNDSTIDDATLADLQHRLRHFHVHDEVLDTSNTNILGLAKQMKNVDFRGYVSLEIIHGENLPEDCLKEVAVRLNQQIAQAFGEPRGR